MGSKAFYPTHNEHIVVSDMNSSNGTNASAISLSDSRVIMNNFYTHTKTSFIGNVPIPTFVELGKKSTFGLMNSQFSLPAIIDINGQCQFIVLGASSS